MMPAAVPGPVTASPGSRREVAERLGSEWFLTIDTLIDNAEDRGIPVEWSPHDRSLLELGNGRYRRRLRYTLTSNTSLLGMKLARDKTLSYQLLRRAGLPVPDSIQVKSGDQGLAAAHTIGYPIAVKPLDANNARGTTIRISTDPKLRSAVDFALAVSPTSTALVDRSIPGHNYRMTVVGGEVVATHKTIPPRVTGTGFHTVKELIDLGNEAISRQNQFFRARSLHSIDALTEEVLAAQGLTLDSVPTLGRLVALRWLGGGNGGSNITCFDAPHPDNRKIAVQAAAVVDVDICGVDIVTPDITVPLWDNGGAIVEVNSLVAFRADIGPREGLPSSPDLAVLDMFFPTNQPSSIPVIAIVQSSASHAICDHLCHEFTLSGHAVGLSTPEKLIIDGLNLPPAGPQTLLRNPAVEIGVIEADLDQLSQGMPDINLLLVPESLDPSLVSRLPSTVDPGEIILFADHLDPASVASEVARRFLAGNHSHG